MKQIRIKAESPFLSIDEIIDEEKAPKRLEWIRRFHILGLVMGNFYRKTDANIYDRDGFVKKRYEYLASGSVEFKGGFQAIGIGMEQVLNKLTVTIEKI